MANHDDLGFVPIPSNNDHSDLGFQPIKSSAPLKSSDSPLQTLEDTARGVASGATFGMSDEAEGALNTAGNVLAGTTPLTLEDIENNYKQNRDIARQANKEAEQRSPIAHTVGTIAGGAIPTLLTGGSGVVAEANPILRLLNAVKVGAISGAASGYGNSESDSTLQDLKNAAAGGLEGAKYGGIVGGALEGLRGVKAGVKALAGTKTGQDIIDSLALGNKGKNIISSEGLDAAEQEARNAADKLALGAREVNKEAGLNVGAAKKAIEDSGKTFDISEDLSKVKDTIEKLKLSNDPDAAKDAKFLQEYLDNVLQGKETQVPSSLSSSEMETIRRGGIDPTKTSFTNAQDIKDTLNSFSGVKGNPRVTTQLAQNELKNPASSISSALKETPELAAANKNYATSMQALENLGLSPNDFIRDAGTKEITLNPQAKLRMNGIVKRMARDTDAGSNASQKLSDSLRLISESNPDMAKALGPEIENVSRTLDLAQKAQKLGILNKSTYLKSGAVYGANAAGLAANATKQTISNATPDYIKNVVQKLASSGGPAAQKVALELADSLKKDNVGRNAALFALQQNPAYRQMINQYFAPTNEENK